MKAIVDESWTLDGIEPPPARHILRDFVGLLNPRIWTIPPEQPDLPRGDGHPVLIAPGVLAGDYTITPLRKFIDRLGYAAHGWGMGINLGPTAKVLRGLERRLFALNDLHGSRVSLIGRSLGGVFMRELAKAHPERVRRLIMICSPVRHPVPSHVATLLHRLGALYDPAFPRDAETLNRPAPVPTTSLYTRGDGFLAWQCCLEEPGPLAENIEISGGHCVASLQPEALRVMAQRLARG